MTRSSYKFSNAFLLLLVIFFIGTVSIPAVYADDDVAAVEEEHGEILNMDIEDEKETVVIAEEKIEEEVEEAVEEPVAEVGGKVEEDEVVPAEEEVVTEVESEKEVIEPPVQEVVKAPSEKKKFIISISKHDAKKIAAFGLGAWGAATGVGWAMQQFGGDATK
mmetsp:Transcript_22834/g.28015  ORF Transcript_22834/g.28015 Transcript_22834/m.28015 type:complete len:163 (-) Transcript_22834:346-834(-)